MMDRVDTCRGAARDAIADVEPAALHDFLTDTLETASMTPGVLTLASAAVLDAESRSAGDSNGKNGERIESPDEATETTKASKASEGTETNADATSGPNARASSDKSNTPGSLEGLAHHAAGVQLIYEGLRLTRTLAHEEPWTGTTGDSRADLEILAADILVARGFYLLARTDAADTAVRTVRRFGRDQTHRTDADEADATSLDANLEQDVLELAVRTGATAVDADPTPPLLAIATDIAAAGPRFPPASKCLPDLEALVRESDAERDFERRPLEADVPTDRVTSAGDH